MTRQQSLKKCDKKTIQKAKNIALYFFVKSQLTTTTKISEAGKERNVKEMERENKKKIIKGV